MIEDRANMIKEMSDGGMTQREIAAKLGISLGSVNRYLQMTRRDQDYFDLDDGFYLDDDGKDDSNEPGKGSPPARGGVAAASADGVVGVSAELREQEAEKMKRIVRETRIHTNNYLRSIGHRIPFDDDDGDTDEDGKDPMKRYGLNSNEIDGSKSEIRNPRSETETAASADGVVGGADELNERNELNKLNELNELNELNKLNELNELNKLPELVYKTLDDKIEVGDIVRDREGRLAKRTNWGWDRCGL
jgi:hypothetical protein